MTGKKDTYKILVVNPESVLVSDLAKTLARLPIFMAFQHTDRMYIVDTLILVRKGVKISEPKTDTSNTA